MRYFSCLLFFVLFAYSSYAQEKYTITGYVINVEEEKVYLDLSSAKVKVGDKVKVLSDKGYFIHPVTKRKIERAQEELATLSIVKVYDSYSEAIPVHRNDLKNIKVGAEVKKSMPIMSTSKMTDENGVVDVMRNVVTDDKDKISVFVAPAQVNDITGIGYFGTYVSDILMEQLMMCDKVRLLDRTVLGMQVDEIDLSGSEYVDASAAIQKGKMLGAERIIQVTMQKPDVVNIRTGIPLASIMGAVQGIANTNIGAQYMSNMQIATLKASVNISVRVIDIETGEVLFMCSSTGKAQGKSQLSMEYGALGGAELNGGAEGFKQTVTGKAIQHAFTRIGRNLNDYFNKMHKIFTNRVSANLFLGYDKESHIDLKEDKIKYYAQHLINIGKVEGTFERAQLYQFLNDTFLNRAEKNYVKVIISDYMNNPSISLYIYNKDSTIVYNEENNGNKYVLKRIK